MIAGGHYARNRFGSFWDLDTTRVTRTAMFR